MLTVSVVGKTMLIQLLLQVVHKTLTCADELNSNGDDISWYLKQEDFAIEDLKIINYGDLSFNVAFSVENTELRPLVRNIVYNFTIMLMMTRLALDIPKHCLICHTMLVNIFSNVLTY